MNSMIVLNPQGKALELLPIVVEFLNQETDKENNYRGLVALGTLVNLNIDS